MGQLERAFSGGKPSAPFEGAKAIPRPLGVVVYFPFLKGLILQSKELTPFILRLRHNVLF